MSELGPTRTYSDLTATERLRALLDERGVEWWAEDDPEDPPYYLVTKWFSNANEQTFEEIPAIRSRSLKAFLHHPRAGRGRDAGAGDVRGCGVREHGHPGLLGVRCHSARGLHGVLLLVLRKEGGRMSERHICAECTDFIGGGDWGLCCKSLPYNDLCYEHTKACDRFKPGRKIHPVILYTDADGIDMMREFTVDACWGRWVDLAKQTIAEGNTDVRIVDFKGGEYPPLLWHPEWSMRRPTSD